MDAQEDKAPERGVGAKVLGDSVAGCTGQGSAVLIEQSRTVLTSRSQDDLVQAPSPFCS